MVAPAGTAIPDEQTEPGAATAVTQVEPEPVIGVAPTMAAGGVNDQV